RTLALLGHHRGLRWCHELSERRWCHANPPGAASPRPPPRRTLAPHTCTGLGSVSAVGAVSRGPRLQTSTSIGSAGDMADRLSSSSPQRRARREKPQRIADEIRALILAGELDEGGSLGSEAALIERFGVSRPSL